MSELRKKRMEMFEKLKSGELPSIVSVDDVVVLRRWIAWQETKKNPPAPKVRKKRNKNKYKKVDRRLRGVWTSPRKKKAENSRQTRFVVETQTRRIIKLALIFLYLEATKNPEDKFF